jgi:membrane associated rhomboid family serine protease
MIEEKPRTLLFIALGLLLFGWVMPFLMVIHLVESTFFLNFLSWGASVGGLYLGVMAVAGLVRRQKK